MGLLQGGGHKVRPVAPTPEKPLRARMPLSIRHLASGLVGRLAWMTRIFDRRHVVGNANDTGGRERPSPNS